MKRFPILGSSGVSVPWELVEPHEYQARANHGQTLQRLADRGGLSPGELAAVLTDRPHRTMKDADACDVIFAKLHEAALAEAVAKACIAVKGGG